jgi:transcriptional regulator with XRE-family HTH domain
MKKIKLLRSTQTEIILRCKLVMELKQLRHKYKITQQQFADYLGKSLATVKSYEKNSAETSSIKLLHLIREVSRMNISLEKEKISDSLPELLNHIHELLKSALENICFNKGLPSNTNRLLADVALAEMIFSNLCKFDPTLDTIIQHIHEILINISSYKEENPLTFNG